MSDKIINLMKKFSKKYEPVNDWIDENVKYPKNNCFFYSSVISLLFPGVKLMKGIHTGQHEDDTGHFVVMLPDGSVIDPTQKQYSKGHLLPEMEEISAKDNIDYILKSKFFKTLKEEDQDKIINISKK